MKAGVVIPLSDLRTLIRLVNHSSSCQEAHWPERCSCGLDDVERRLRDRGLWTLRPLTDEELAAWELS